MRECDVMETKEEQRFTIRFYVRRGKSATATFQKLKETYGEQCLSRATILRSHAAFAKEGRKSAKVKPSTGRPKASVTAINVNTVNALMQEDRHLTMRGLSAIMNINIEKNRFCHNFVFCVVLARGRRI